jgi:hypothetical protein
MTFSPFRIIERPFIANIVDYSIPYSFERSVVLTHITNKMNSNIFSYFSAFDSNVWVLIVVYMIIITTIVSLFHRILLLKKELNTEIIFNLFLKFYANFIDKGLFKFKFIRIFL